MFKSATCGTTLKPLNCQTAHLLNKSWQFKCPKVKMKVLISYKKWRPISNIYKLLFISWCTEAEAWCCVTCVAALTFSKLHGNVDLILYIHIFNHKTTGRCHSTGFILTYFHTEHQEQCWNLVMMQSSCLSLLPELIMFQCQVTITPHSVTTETKPLQKVSLTQEVD